MLLQGDMKKVLKALMTAKLIKEVKSVVHKSKKIYMLYELGASCAAPLTVLFGGEATLARVLAVRAGEGAHGGPVVHRPPGARHGVCRGLCACQPR